MNIYDAELTNEHYKILKFISHRHHVSDKSLLRRFNNRYLHSNIAYLRTHGFLLQDCDTSNNTHRYIGDIYISSLGRNAYFILREEKCKFWKELLLSKWLDVTVSFITAAITSANWDSISTFFINLFTT